MVTDIYKGYLGRIAGDRNWDSHMRHHYQPIWAAAIKAHARHRSRAKAMKLAREHNIWPVKGLTDAWTFSRASATPIPLGQRKLSSPRQ